MNFNPTATFFITFIFFLVLIFNPLLLIILVPVGFFILGYVTEPSRKRKNPFGEVRKQSDEQRTRKGKLKMVMKDEDERK